MVIVIQCQGCEFYGVAPDGTPQLRCDPFSTIKEPECLVKWQLVQLTVISKSHQATLDMHQRLAPLQEKMFRHMEREIDSVDESERWKVDDEEEDEDPFRL